MSAASEILNEQQIERLWQYRNQVDQEYYGRLNFFLIFESILLAAAVQVDSSGHASSTVSKVFVLLGLLITLVWLYAQARVAHILSYLRSLCNEYLPEYRLFRAYKWPDPVYPAAHIRNAYTHCIYLDSVAVYIADNEQQHDTGPLFRTY